MRIEAASLPGRADVPNQDLTMHAPGMVVLLDGAGGPSEDGGGCIHGVEWVVRQLGVRLITCLAKDYLTLTEILARSVAEVSDLHRESCDLRHPGTPSTTVTMAREVGDVIEYLSVHDSTIVLTRKDKTTDVISDRRVEGIPELRRLWSVMCNAPLGSAEHVHARKAYMAEEMTHRNTPGGYWVVGSNPAVAEEAVTGSVRTSELRSVALFSDGVGDYVDVYNLATWPEVILTVEKEGPTGMIGLVRDAEVRDPCGVRWPRFKVHDDASIVHWTLP